MKKIIAVILALVAVFTLSVSAMAAGNSPSGSVYVNVTIHSAIGVEGVTEEGVSTKLPVNSVVALTKDDAEGKFDSWAIYKPDGSIAVEGTDYTIKSGSLKDPNLSITAFTDLIICGNYNGKITDPSTGDHKDPASPPTFDATVIALATLMLGATALAIISKKRLCK